MLPKLALIINQRILSIPSTLKTSHINHRPRRRWRLRPRYLIRLIPSLNQRSPLIRHQNGFINLPLLQIQYQLRPRPLRLTYHHSTIPLHILILLPGIRPGRNRLILEIWAGYGGILLLLVVEDAGEFAYSGEVRI